MTAVLELGPDDWRDWRRLRLRALADAPEAFGSTHQRELEFTEQEWRDRLSRGPVLALLAAGEPVAVGGLLVGYLPVPQVWGMWTDPASRGRGHGGRILDSLLGAGPAVGQAIELHVNVANTGARRLYETRGFVATGELSPLRPGSTERIELMRRPGR